MGWRLLVHVFEKIVFVELLDEVGDRGSFPRLHGGAVWCAGCGVGGWEWVILTPARVRLFVLDGTSCVCVFTYFRSQYCVYDPYTEHVRTVEGKTRCVYACHICFGFTYHCRNLIIQHLLAVIL